jgi:hypothetical protein
MQQMGGENARKLLYNKGLLVCCAAKARNLFYVASTTAFGKNFNIKFQGV